MALSEAEALVYYCKINKFVKQVTENERRRKKKKHNKRVITEQDEMIFRLVHHARESRATNRQFTQVECSRILNIPASTVSRRLKHIEQVMPQYFPLLTSREVAIFNRRITRGMTHVEIAECLRVRKGFEGLTKRIVKKTLDRVKAKGYNIARGNLGKVLSYDAGWDGDDDSAREGMDAHIKLKI